MLKIAYVFPGQGSQEVGPGNTLKKLIKQILPKAKVYNVSDSKSVEKVTR